MDSPGGAGVADPLSRPRSSRSPWAAATSWQVVRLSPPARAPDADLTVPGSKSLSNRALIVAAMAEGESVLEGVLRSDDTYWAVDALRRLGVQVEIAGQALAGDGPAGAGQGRRARAGRPGAVGDAAAGDGGAQAPGGTVRVRGCGGRWPVPQAALYLGSAGTLARFLPGVLAACDRGEWLLEGSPQLSSRPIVPLVEALRALGASVEYAGEAGRLPLRVRGGGIDGGAVRISGRESSQFVSGLLLAAPYARRPVDIEVVDDLVQPAYVGMTAGLMGDFGVPVHAGDGWRRLQVRPARYRGRRYTLEADASTACYFLALAAVTGGRVRVDNVGYASVQPDARFVDLLERLGCRVERGERFLEVQGAKALRGGFSADMKPMSDQALTLGALAVFADGPVEVTGVAHIRHHESNRIGVFCRNLSRLGIRAEEQPDGFVVHPAPPDWRPPAGVTLDPYDDHRQAMALALIGARVPGIAIRDPGCVSKTCPTFFEDLRRLGCGVEYR